MRVLLQWLFVALTLLPTTFGQKPGQEAFVSAETGFLRDKDDRLIAKLPIYTQLRVLQREGNRLEVTNQRVTGWIHKGQVRPQFTFDTTRLQGIAKKRLEDARLLHREGWLFFQRDDLATAEKRWRQAVELTKQTIGNGPTLAQLHSDLGYLYLQQFKTNEAQQSLAQALEALAAAGKTNHPVRAEILNNQSMVFSNQGQSQQAIAAIEEALRIVKQAYGKEHSDTVVLTANLAFQYVAAGQNQQAQPLWKEYINLAKSVFGPNSKEVSLGKLQYGATLVTAAKFRQARRYLNSAIRLREQNDASPNALAEAYAYAGLMYMGLEKWHQARKFLLKALNTGDENLYESRIAMSAHLALAKIFAQQSEMFDALSAMEHLQKGISATEKLYGNVPYVQQLRTHHAQMKSLARKAFSSIDYEVDEGQMIMVFDTTSIMNKDKVVATVPSGTRLWAYKTDGDWLLVKAPDTNARGFIRKSSAASLQKNAMMSLLSRMGTKARQKFTNLIEAEKKRSDLKQAGQAKEGFRVLEAAIKELDDAVIEESGLKLENSIISAFRLHISSFQALEGRISESLATLESVEEQQLIELGDHPHLAATKMLLADQLAQSGDFRRAEEEGRDALRMIDSVMGSTETASTLARSFLGSFLVREGRIQESKKLIEEAFAAEKAVERKDDYPKFLAFRAMAELALAEERIEDAVALERQAVAIAKTLDELYDPMLMIGAHSGLAKALFAAGETEQAIVEAEETKNLARNELGAEHPVSIDACEELSRMLLMSGNHERAVELAKESLDLAILIGGEDSHRTNGLREVIGLGQLITGKQKEGLKSLDHSFRIFNHYVRNVLSDLPARRQFKILEGNEGLRSQAINLVLEHPNQIEIVERTVEWLLNTKSIAFESAAVHQRMRKMLKTDYERDLFEKWISQRRQIATFSLESKDEETRNARKIQFEALTELASETAAEIGPEFEKLAKERSESKFVRLDDVRSQIDQDTILIELLRFDRTSNFREIDAEPNPDLYGAWIIPPHGAGDVMFINLGEAEKIDALVASARKAIASAPVDITNVGEVESTELLRELMKPLTERLIEPIRKNGGKSKHWLISPDSQLWLLPWAALPIEQNQFLVEQVSLRLLVSGRTLVDNDAEEAKKNPPVIFADPDFDLGGESIQNAIREFQLELNLDRTRSFRPELGRAVRLPGTRMEAQSILPRLETYNGVKPEVYLGAKSAERVFKELISPPTLVMSTHGFFLDQKSDQSPLRRCGLLLSGCNLREQNLKHTGEDGVLTGEEIVEADLRGTRLVVLSACESGLGELQQGEGVAGLRQAFELAGARSVVATLWQIPDIETARLVSDMFQALAEGQSPTLALQSAQQSRIDNRRKRHGAAHPFFWSGIGLSGN